MLANELERIFTHWGEAALHSMPDVLGFSTRGGFPLGLSPSFLLFLWVAVLVPSAIVAIMNGVEGLVDPLGRIKRSMKVGWDLSVLGLGAGGSVVMDPDVLRFLGTPGVIGAVTSSLVLSLGAAVVIAQLRRRNDARRIHAAAALILGAVALAVPAFLAFHRR